jgi:hypothetical protein
VLNALAQVAPNFRLTIRSALPSAKLQQRIKTPYRLIAETTDFGYVMIDATRVDLSASATAYRQAHADWPARVADEARFLADLKPDLVLTNVSYLPLAGAAAAGIPALSLCSLNWADLFDHYFGDQPWAKPIHAEMLAAYRSAQAFLRVTPGMAMHALANAQTVGPIAALGTRRDLGLNGDKTILIAMGGIAHRLPLEAWPRLTGIRWLVPGAWGCTHPDALAIESFGLGFTDLLCSVAAVVTKPGYGTYTESAANGVPVLYQRRDNWPEQEGLIEWLQANARCLELSAADLAGGRVSQPWPNSGASRRWRGQRDRRQASRHGNRPATAKFTERCRSAGGNPFQRLTAASCCRVAAQRVHPGARLAVARIEDDQRENPVVELFGQRRAIAGGCGEPVFPVRSATERSWAKIDVHLAADAGGSPAGGTTAIASSTSSTPRSRALALLKAESPEASPKSKLNSCIWVSSARIAYWNAGQPPGKLRASAAAARLSEATSSHSSSSSRRQLLPTATPEAVWARRRRPG